VGVGVGMWVGCMGGCDLKFCAALAGGLESCLGGAEARGARRCIAGALRPVRACAESGNVGRWIEASVLGSSRASPKHLPLICLVLTRGLVRAAVYPLLSGLCF
jgi:hypothetical protein